MEMKDYKYLEKINSPQDLKALKHNEVIEYCAEARDFIIENVLENGGHLASNLGAIELTAAIHRVFDLPDDKVVFDVGHQCYLHKMITGRRDMFGELRRPGGLSGFETRKEGEFDFFGTGHASTSISAAMGFAASQLIDGGQNYAIAVVGDGAFTGGMIHEALNNCSPKMKLIIILNENEMSISKNIGGFAMYIARIRSSKKYYNLKRGIRKTISKIPLIGKPIVEFMRKQKKSLKNLIFSSNYFEDMGIFYLGPCDGNDYVRTERLLKEAKDSGRCTLVHLKTKKGLGYKPSEDNPGSFHGVSPKNSVKVRTFSQEFGELITNKAKEEKSICAITAAMSSGTGLDIFAKEFPERFFDVGIAEEHAATFAAGLCASGKRPVFAVYSTFLQRCYDNIIHDIALQKLPVVFTLDRAGLAEADGPTHHGIFDVSMIMSIPDTVMYAPLNFKGLAKCFDAALNEKLPSFVRYKSGGETVLNPEIQVENAFFNGKTKDFILTSNKNETENVIITYGKLSSEASTAVAELTKSGKNISLIILEQLKGDDEIADCIASLIKEGDGCVLFAEEGILNGGAASVYMSMLRKNPKLQSKRFKILAIEDFGLSKKNETIFQTCGISYQDMINAIL